MKKKQSKSDEISEDFPTKKDIEAAQNLARRVSPMMFDLLEAEETSEKEKEEDADPV